MGPTNVSKKYSYYVYAHKNDEDILYFGPGKEIYLKWEDTVDMSKVQARTLADSLNPIYNNEGYTICIGCNVIEVDPMFSPIIVEA